MNTLRLHEHRCVCGKLLLKGIFFDGALEIKCKRCGVINTIGTIKLADDATHYLLIINSNGNIVNVSDFACRILGYTSDEFIGKHFTEINPTMPNEIGKKFFGPESVLNEDNYLQLDTVHLTKDGKRLPIIVRLRLYCPTSKEKYVLLSAELKNAIHDKIIPDHKALDFLDSACDYYFDIDKNGIGEYISPSVEKLFGFTPDMVIGKNYFDFLPVKMRAKSRNKFRHFLAKAQPYRMKDAGGADAHGKPVHNEQYFTPKFDDSGKFTGYRVLGWVTKKPKAKKLKA